MIHCEIKEFKNEFKALNRKYKSLKGDLELFKTILKHDPTGIKRRKNFKTLTEQNKSIFIKARFRCKSLNKTLRIVYCYSPKENKITFIELFAKSDKANHDTKRLNNFISESN